MYHIIFLFKLYTPAHSHNLISNLILLLCNTQYLSPLVDEDLVTTNVIPMHIL